ncbi:MAG: RteC domain-containing protein [Bacteroidales bacterium]|jgi:hypothetical protein|nr:RteC domain-containing protein [Bacteroidales bacterium]
MKDYFRQLTESIEIELSSVLMDSYNISIEESFMMIEFFQKKLNSLRDFLLQYEFKDTQEEILFFKEMKPEILSHLIYFNKIYTIELKRPNGRDSIRKKYYEKELDSLTYFFNRNLDFYQYYRSKLTIFDEYYFVRGKMDIRLCVDSSQFISDPLFSTGYDYKVAKILANEMLRIYLNRKLQRLDSDFIPNDVKRSIKCIKWTASKVAVIELGYALHSYKALNNGNADIREIMDLLESCFDIELNDYYRTYIALRNRKKDRTNFLNSLIESLTKRMDEDDLR